MQFVVSLFHRNLHTEAQDGKLTNLMRFLTLVRQLLSPAVKSLSGVNSEQATCDLLLGFYKPLSSVMHLSAVQNKRIIGLFVQQDQGEFLELCDLELLSFNSMALLL